MIISYYSLLPTFIDYFFVINVNILYFTILIVTHGKQFILIHIESYNLVEEVRGKNIIYMLYTIF